jgi:hypothetical protein
VPGGHPVKLGEINPVVERPELDAGVAQNVRVGRPARLDLGHAVGHDPAPVLIRQVHHPQLDASLAAHRLRVSKVFLPGALGPEVAEVLLKPYILEF